MSGVCRDLGSIGLLQRLPWLGGFGVGSLCVYVCVCVREREREREGKYRSDDVMERTIHMQ